MRGLTAIPSPAPLRTVKAIQRIKDSRYWDSSQSEWARRVVYATLFETEDEAKTEITWLLQHEDLRDDVRVVDVAL